MRPSRRPSRSGSSRRKVRPVLVENCFKCHGPEKQKAHLRLDSRAGGAGGGRHGPAVVPGKPEESLLVTAISHDDEVLKMPPSKKLDAARIAALTQWVKMGAPWPGSNDAASRAGSSPEGRVSDHRQGPRPLGVPADRAARRPRGPGPALGQATRSTPSSSPGSRRRGCKPNPPAVEARADPPRHLRPHRPAADARGGRRVRRTTRRPTAYEALVDRLLDSPRYGEKWGRHWLDLVRFAETNSYERDDPKPNAWRYRDYVIRSFNDDKPYDRFVREQLAGDELPDGGTDSLDRHRLLSPGHLGRRADRPRAGPLRRPRRHRGHDRPGLPRPDDRLRPLPRPQARPDPAEGLLPARLASSGTSTTTATAARPTRSPLLEPAPRHGWPTRRGSASSSRSGTRSRPRSPRSRTSSASATRRPRATSIGASDLDELTLSLLPRHLGPPPRLRRPQARGDGRAPGRPVRPRPADPRRRVRLRLRGDARSSPRTGRTPSISTPTTAPG